MDWANAYHTHDQGLFLQKHGKFIAGLNYYGYNAALYLYEKEYYEIFYNLARQKIDQVQIADPRRLHLYLEKGFTA